MDKERDNEGLGRYRSVGEAARDVGAALAREFGKRSTDLKEEVERDRDVQRAMRRLWQTVFHACFMAMCAWTLVTGVASWVLRWVGR